MPLSSDLIAKFAKAINDSKSKNKKEDYAYGTIVLNAQGKTCVKLDGSDEFTPISSTTDLLPGDRAMVLIKNHSVIVTGNISSPAARSKDVSALNTGLRDLNTALNDRTSAYAIVNLIYPVGSIYMSVADVSPQVVFGGTWERIKDRFLLASGDSYDNGSVGGEADHVLTVEEMPSHTHKGRIGYAHSVSSSYTPGSDEVYLDAIISPVAVTTTNNGVSNIQQRNLAPSLNTGGSQAHNNMPPYLVVHIWKRIG